MTTSTPTPRPETPAAVTLWETWRAERTAGLSEEHGWLTLTALHFLTGTPTTYDGLPGTWWADDDGIHVEAGAAAGVLPADTSHGVPAATEPLDGVHTVDVTQTGSTIAAIVPEDVAVEAGVRSGRPLLRVRDPKSPTATGFTGVPVFDHDESWVVDAPVRWYAEPRPDVVGAAQPGLTHQVMVNGEVDLERDGQTVTLRLVGSVAGSGTLSFTDTSAETPAWRSLTVEGAIPTDLTAPGQTVRLDLNYAYDMPCAFTDYGTCPQPLEGNDVPFAVTAGEKRPR